MLPALVSEPLEVSRRYEHPDMLSWKRHTHRSVHDPASQLFLFTSPASLLHLRGPTAMTASYNFAFLTWGTDRPGRLLYVYTLPECITGMQPFQKTVKDTQAKEPHALLLCNLITTPHGNGTA